MSRHDQKARHSESWVEPFIQELAIHGVEGRVVASGKSFTMKDDPEMMAAAQRVRLFPAMYRSHTPLRGWTDPNDPDGWLPAAEANRACAEDAARQCFADDGWGPVTGIVWGYHSTVTPIPDLAAEPLTAMASVARNVRLLTWGAGGVHRDAWLSNEGEYILSLADNRLAAMDWVGRLRSSLVVEPALAAYGFIRNSRWGTFVMHQFFEPGTADHVRPQEEGITGPENPWGDSGRWQQNYHLHAEYALDAHGINLLTGQHLDRAQNLDQWTVKKIDTDRYLVEARDLSPWFSGKPDPDVLREARRDFGDMLITWKVVCERPGPQTAYPPHLPQPSK